MPVTLRAATPEDDAPIERVRALANGGDPAPAALDQATLSRREHERCLVGLDGSDVVATSLGYGFSISVPGADRTVRAAGLAGIAVSPTHRRRGLLREIMDTNLAAAHERGEPVSILWPSEAPIYRRFGYGPATTTVTYEIEHHRAELRPEAPGHDRAVAILAPDPTKVAATVAPVHDAVRRHVPGMLDRSPPWWAHRTASAATTHVWIVVEGADGPSGYASYRVEQRWGQDGPENQLLVSELVATDPAGHATLWRYLLGIDLVRHVRAWGRPPDDPLPHLVTDARRLRRRSNDGAWLRLVDVGAALAGRAYRAELDVAIGVVDESCPWNARTWRLRAGPGDAATCEPTDAAADLVLSVADLARPYLGDTPVSVLHRAGLVDEATPGAVERVDAAFSWPVAPWAVTWF